MIDELAPETVEVEEGTGDSALPGLDSRLVEAITTLREWATRDINVIITTETRHLSTIRSTLGAILDEFVVVQVDPLSPDERTTYVSEVCGLLEWDSSDDAVRLMANSAGESLTEIYDFLTLCDRQGIKRLDGALANEFATVRRDRWTSLRNAYAGTVEGHLIDVLTLFVRYSLPADFNLICECVARRSGGVRVFARLRARKAVRGLEGTCLSIKGKEIIGDSPFRLVSATSEEQTSEDLASLQGMFEISEAPRRMRSAAVDAGLSLSRWCHETRRYDAARDSAQRITKARGFQRVSAPQRSQVWFTVGQALVAAGRRNTEAARDAFARAVDAEPRNRAARYALAMASWRLGNRQEAFRNLEEVTSQKPTDLLAWTSRLYFLLEADFDAREVTPLYLSIVKLMAKGGYSIRRMCSAGLTLARFWAKTGQSIELRGRSTAWRRCYAHAAQRYEALLSQVPEDERALAAVARNQYGWFLLNLLGEESAGVYQLEEALRAWPDHTYTLHLLATVYARRFEHGIDPEANSRRASELLSRLLTVAPDHYPGLLLRSRLKGLHLLADIRSDTLWGRASAVLLEYLTSLEPHKRGHQTLHNLKALHSAGSFVWAVERAGSKHGITKDPDCGVPTADVLLREATLVPPALSATVSGRRHGIFAHLSLADYYATTRFRAGHPALALQAVNDAAAVVRAAPGSFLPSREMQLLKSALTKIGEHTRMLELEKELSPPP